MNRLCEVAGYDSVLVETVGVSQSEVAVGNMHGGHVCFTTGVLQC